MNSQRFNVLVVGVCLVVCVSAAIGYYALRSGEVTKPHENRIASKSERGHDRSGADASAMGFAGKKTGIQSSSKATPKLGDAKIVGYVDCGKTPKVDPNANPQVRSVVEALKNKNHPERLSPAIAPKPFDAEAYKVNPVAYLEVVEPGRVFQTAQPGKGTPRLLAISPGLQKITQGESVVLQVSAPSGSPVSFNSFDLGQFENQLTAITVKADDQGIAEVRFQASPGTIDDVHILAGCPLTSGQARFVVNIQMPKDGKVQGAASR